LGRAEDWRDIPRQLPSHDIGESWDVACHENGTSMIANGRHKGKALDQLIKEYGRKLMGTAWMKRTWRNSPADKDTGCLAASFRTGSPGG